MWVMVQYDGWVKRVEWVVFVVWWVLTIVQGKVYL